MAQRLLTFKIDPALDRLWSAEGLTQVERAEESRKLEAALLRAYQQFIAEASNRCEGLRNELRDTIVEYQRQQLVFGEDTEQLHLNSRMALTDQIAYVKKLIDELRQDHLPIMREFSEIHAALQEQFQILRVDDDGQGEFAHIGDEDLTVERLERFKSMLKNLESEIMQRRKLFDSLSYDLQGLANDLQEQPPEDVQIIVDRGFIDNDSISLLKETVTRFKKQREINQDEILKSWDILEKLYQLLGVDESNQISYPENPSSAAAESLRAEVEYLQQEADSRVPTVVKQLRREIRDRCETLHLPKKLRPKFTGSSQEEEVVYLRNEKERLDELLIRSQPIVDTISQIEALRSACGPNEKAKLGSRERGASKRMIEDEKLRRRAIEQMPKLEQKLLKLLVQFREENGYDFEFEGIDISQICPIREDDNMSTKTRQSIGKSLLKQKLSETTNKRKRI